MLIGHISDVHLGYTQYRKRERKKDFYNAFEKALKECKNRKVDLVLITGDLFDTINPDVETMLFVKDVILKYSKLYKIVIIPGNHDKVSSFTKKSPVQIAEKIKNVVVIVEPKVLKFKDKYFYAFPIQNISELKDFLKRVNTEKENSYLLYHGPLSHMNDSFFRFFDDEEKYPSTELLSKYFKVVFLGDIHKKVKEIHNGTLFVYSGSTEFNSLTEVRNGFRGFGVYDTDKGEYKHVSLDGRKVYLLQDPDVDYLDTLEEDSMVFIESSSSELLSMYKSLQYIYKDKFLIYQVSLKSKNEQELLVETIQERVSTLNLKSILKRIEFPKELVELVLDLIENDYGSIPKSELDSFLEDKIIKFTQEKNVNIPLWKGV